MSNRSREHRRKNWVFFCLLPDYHLVAQLKRCLKSPPPTPSSGGACLLAHQWGHPRGLGQDGVVPGRHAGQRRIAGPAEGPAEGLDVEFDPGERPPPFPESPQCQRRSTPPRGEGHQRRHLPRPGCGPASQSLLVIIVISGTAILEKDGRLVADEGHSVPTKARTESQYVTLTLWFAQKEAVLLFLHSIWNLKHLRWKSALHTNVQCLHALIQIRREMRVLTVDSSGLQLQDTFGFGTKDGKWNTSVVFNSAVRWNARSLLEQQHYKPSWTV